jgi:hypothetical protein
MDLSADLWSFLRDIVGSMFIPSSLKNKAAKGVRSSLVYLFCLSAFVVVFAMLLELAITGMFSLREGVGLLDYFKDLAASSMLMVYAFMIFIKVSYYLVICIPASAIFSIVAVFLANVIKKKTPQYDVTFSMALYAQTPFVVVLEMFSFLVFTPLIEVNIFSLLGILWASVIYAFGVRNLLTQKKADILIAVE